MQSPAEILLETDRLIHRKFTLADLPALIEHRTDPDVSRYLGGAERQTPEYIEKRLRFYIECYEKVGFGMCAMFLKETGEMIGVSGLQPLEDTGEIEVGYSLDKKYWRQGIGQETAMGWLRYGFETARLERIVAVAEPENTGSWRVMEKCGMRYEKTETHYDIECVFYAISREEFERNRK